MNSVLRVFVLRVKNGQRRAERAEVEVEVTHGRQTPKVPCMFGELQLPATIALIIYTPCLLGQHAISPSAVYPLPLQKRLRPSSHCPSSPPRPINTAKMVLEATMIV